VSAAIACAAVACIPGAIGLLSSADGRRGAVAERADNNACFGSLAIDAEFVDGQRVGNGARVLRPPASATDQPTDPAVPQPT